MPQSPKVPVPTRSIPLPSRPVATVRAGAVPRPSSTQRLNPGRGEPTPPRRTGGGKRFLVLLAVILAHVAFFFVAGYFVVQQFTDRKLTFKVAPPPENEKKKEIQHVAQLSQKLDTMSAPMQTQRITTTGLSPVTLPEMPATPDNDSNPLDQTQGSGLLGKGLDTGMATLGALSAVSQRTMPLFGTTEKGAGLEGTLYDLKQTRSNRATGMTPGNYRKIIMDFVNRDWRPSLLAEYFVFPKKIYAGQFFIPCIPAAEGPKAFGAEQQVQPSMWVIHYEGRVVAPVTGTFRFVGAADDILIVRFNRKLALNGSLHVSEEDPMMMLPLKTRTAVAYNGCFVGPPFKVVAGRSYDIEVLLGEQPGGGFFAQLMLEQDGVEYKKDANGLPILPVFRVQDVATPQDPYAIPHAGGSEVWKLEVKNGVTD